MGPRLSLDCVVKEPYSDRRLTGRARVVAALFVVGPSGAQPLIGLVALFGYLPRAVLISSQMAKTNSLRKPGTATVAMKAASLRATLGR